MRTGNLLSVTQFPAITPTSRGFLHAVGIVMGQSSTGKRKLSDVGYTDELTTVRFWAFSTYQETVYLYI